MADFTLEEFEKEAARMVLSQKPRKDRALVITLSGELGSGKTTFAKAIARTFGVEEEVTSPTFVIEKVYKTKKGPFKKLFHIDAYRLHGKHELEALGWRGIVSDPSNIIVLEWPEGMPDLVPMDAVRVTLHYATETTRSIAYENDQ